MPNKKEPIPSTSRKGRLHKPAVRLIVMLALPVALVAVGAYYYVVGARHVSTENAFIKADKIVISTDVSERVVKMAINENDVVTAGQLLFELDEEPFRIAADSARARLAETKQEIEALRAEYLQKISEQKIVASDVKYFQREFDRQNKLSIKGFASQSKFDGARRNLQTARQEIATIHQEIARARAGLGGDPDIPVDQHPRVREAKAAADRAVLDLRRTKIHAPAPGVITNFELQIGEFIQAGRPVFSVVGNETVWVRANIRETNMTRVRVGQEATIRVDTYPDQTMRAVIASISPATGTEFAVLPPQNASGNWVKVVQRIPVRLELMNIPKEPPLRAGMSVTVEIDTGYERALPSFIATALAWVQGRQ